MLVIEKIEGNMCEVLNTETGTPFEIPTHWLQIPGLVEAGKIMGIEILDHIIIGDDEYVSLKEREVM